MKIENCKLQIRRQALANEGVVAGSAVVMPRIPASCLRFCLQFAICNAFLASAASAQTTRDTIAAVQPKVVKIFGAGGIKSLAAHGTGFFVSKEGHIATIWSHVLDADLVSVVLSDGDRADQGCHLQRSHTHIALSNCGRNR